MIPKTTPQAWAEQVAYAVPARVDPPPQATTLQQWVFKQRCLQAFFHTLGSPSQQHTFLRQQKHAAIYLPRRN